MNRLDQAIIDVANQSIPEEQVAQAADRVRSKLFAETRTAPERLRNCGDFQAIIPAYLNKTLSAGRALLLQDHTRECVACRHALAEARTGAAPTLIRPVTPPSRTIPNVWAIAAMAVVSLGLGGWLVSKFTGSSAKGEAAVQTVQGTLYAISDRGSTPIFSGKAIAEGQRVRTAKDSIAMVRLPDGSLVEMNERSEISVNRSGHGLVVRLDRGNIIVQAAKQRNGTLDVITGDCTVSVKGTIFAVDHGTKGSQVTVVEGSVKVEQGAKSQMLKPGDQVSTDPSLVETGPPAAISWSRDSARYLALLGEFSVIKKGLEQMPSAALRHDTKLLSYVPDNTILYASIPNVSASLGEAERLFQARLKESEVLRTWWDEQKDGPKLQEMLDKLKTFSDYLGDEIVFTVSGDWQGNFSAPVILAQVKKPGLEAFLNSELNQMSVQGADNLPQVVQLGASSSSGPENGFYRKTRRNRKAAEGPMTIAVKDNLIAVAWGQDQINAIAERVADSSGSRDGGLFANVRSAYERGAGWLLCVNMEQIARNTVHRGEDGPKLPPGLERMRYLIVERKDVAGKTENQATLTFEGGRSGIAAWLAEPSPMGSLDFVSPNATFAVSLALRSPQSMLGDLFKTLAEQDPKFEARLDQIHNETGLRLTPSLGEPLGGDVTFAVDGPLLPLPSWKLVAEVYSPDRMQYAIDQLVAAVNKSVSAKCPDCALKATQEQVGDRTFHVLRSDQFAYEIDYVFVDSYLVMAPSRSLLLQAIQNRETGFVLSRSDSFRSQLPQDGRMNFSAIVYHNLGSTLAPLAGQLGTAAGTSQAQRASIQALVTNSGPGLIYAYGESDRIMVASSGGFFGLDLNSLALPALINRGMHPVQ